MISFDELILITLIETSLPDASIEPQVTIGKHLVDLKVTWNQTAVAVEFLGPYHFIRRSWKDPTDPRVRQKAIEDAGDVECVLWPYWIQRCARNVLALFDRSQDGLGSVWSTSAQFGDFCFRDSSDLILNINSRFRIERQHGVGYMYTNEIVSKPVHPIVRRIREGREQIGKLIPPGPTANPRYWIPHELWSLCP